MARYIKADEIKDYVLDKIAEQRKLYHNQTADVLLSDIYLHIDEMESKEL